MIAHNRTQATRVKRLYLTRNVDFRLAVKARPIKDHRSCGNHASLEPSLTFNFVMTRTGLSRAP